MIMYWKSCNDFITQCKNPWRTSFFYMKKIRELNILRNQTKNKNYKNDMFGIWIKIIWNEENTSVFFSYHTLSWKLTRRYIKHDSEWTEINFLSTGLKNPKVIESNLTKFSLYKRKVCLWFFPYTHRYFEITTPFKKSYYEKTRSNFELHIWDIQYYR